jgi:hypothetical protein
VRSRADGLKYEECAGYAGTGERPSTPPLSNPPRERGPRKSPSAVAIVERHRVCAGETLHSVASSAGLTWKKLAKFNFGTDDVKKVHAHLKADVGSFVARLEGYSDRIALDRIHRNRDADLLEEERAIAPHRDNIRIRSQRLLDPLFVVDDDAVDRAPRRLEAPHADVETKAHALGATELDKILREEMGVARLIGRGIQAAHDPDLRVPERRLDLQAFFRSLNCHFQAPRAKLPDLPLCALEFELLLVQMQDAARLRLVADSGLAAQLVQLLSAVQSEGECRFGIAARPLGEAFKKEAQAP